MVASPTATLMMQKEYEEKRRKLDDEHVNKIYEMYGMDKSQMNTLDNDLLLGETENYAEYDEDGNVIKGVAPVCFLYAMLIYRQFLLPSTRKTSILAITSLFLVPGMIKSIIVGGMFFLFLSFVRYACCKQTEKNAYCMAN